jgi:Mg/Co/Ni transporter MgtE
MPDNEKLTHAFLENHPADAARVLEKLPPESAAALLQTIPVRLASPVLRHMLPIAGVRCLEQMDDSDIAGLLRGAGAQTGVALLRYFDAGRRTRLMGQLPTTLTLAYELLLGYPEGTVGAWMDTQALALPADMNVSEALERVRRADQSLIADPFVIDRNQRLLGYVEIADLLRAEDRASLVQLVRPSPHRLPSQALLKGLREHRGWREASTLPVVERGDILVGAFTHAALQRALSIEQSASVSGSAEDTLAGIAGTYWFGVSAMLQALISLLPVERKEKGS